MKATLAIAAAFAAIAANAADSLESGFADPSQSARPRVWWHWIDGNVTREGITRDLEWMKRAHIGGFQMFDVGRGYPTLVDQPAPFMSPRWKSLLHHASVEAKRLGLEMTVAASPGWSETGGPSVAPASAMKKIVWSETRIAGGTRFTGKLPMPPASNGPFQDLAGKPAFQINGEPKENVAAPTATYYADTRVIAYRVAEREPEGVAATASQGQPDATLLRDGRFDRAFVMPVADANWVAFDFGAPGTIRSLRFGIEWPKDVASPMPEGVVEASDDGKSFRTIASLAVPASASGLPVYTLSLPETRARFFRVSVKPGSGFMFPTLPSRAIREFRFTEIDFSAAARPNRFEHKAAFAVARDYDAIATPSTSAAIATQDVIDVTAHVKADGTLDWTSPPGDWSVIRFGTSLTGKTNAPATQAGTGFEVDKYSAAEVRRYLDTYFGEIARSARVDAILTDSFEAGQANWTPALLEEFHQRRGYDATPYLPVLADHVVGSSEKTDRFLWDFRRTLADLIAEAHYRTIGEYAKQHHFAYYGEAMGVDWPATADGLQDKRYASVPMAEFWQVAPDKPSGGNHIADVREAASAAHVYGQNIVATESFTGFPLPGVPPPYTSTPALLKPLADRFMALGVNRFIVHTAVHQPLEKAPGFTLSIFGQYFSRHETWAEMARGWMDYLARASDLLQQGHYAADLAYFYGEGAAISVPDGGATDPAIPAGYQFDFVCRDMLLNDFVGKDGKLTTKSGMAYPVLVLPASATKLTLPVLRKLREFAAAGVAIVGARPGGSPSLGDDDAQVAAAIAELWDAGKVRAKLADVLAERKIEPDFSFSGSDKVVALHRKLAGDRRKSPWDGELFFIANQGAEVARIEASLRVSGREAELWHADDGHVEQAAYRQERGRTIVPLELAPYESVFVVLRKPAKNAQRVLTTVGFHKLASLGDDWDVRFTPGRGAPSSAHFPALESWSDSADPGLRYFSGIGSYRTNLDVVDPATIARGRILLDLGEVHELAEVFVNGKSGGIAWKPPYRVDVTHLLKPGRNQIRIDVANVWANRFIGDRQPDAGAPIAYSTFDLWAPDLVHLPYTKDTPPLPSGLIGPVQLLTETR